MVYIYIYVYITIKNYPNLVNVTAKCYSSDFSILIMPVSGCFRLNNDFAVISKERCAYQLPIHTGWLIAIYFVFLSVFGVL